MDEEAEEFNGVCVEVEPFEYDPFYEYDAARFFDFTRPQTSSEVREADRWFEHAPCYPPSPLSVKLYSELNIPKEETRGTANMEKGDNTNSFGNKSSAYGNAEVSPQGQNAKGLKYHEDLVQEIQSKTKSMAEIYEPRSSTLMKPTASHLAKLNIGQDLYSGRVWGRFQKPPVKINERNLQTTPGFESDATKRQKLERGYLRKVAHLKHQTLLLHKIAHKFPYIDGNFGPFKPKVTIPREPNLQTAQRAQRQRSKNSSSSSEQAKPEAAKFKARPLNQKGIQQIFEAPPSRLTNKTITQRPEFQEFQLKTMQRVMQHSSANVDHWAQDLHNCDVDTHSGAADIKRYSNEDAQEIEKLEGLNKVKNRAFCKKELKLWNDKRLLLNPPIELFKKLTLKSDSESNIALLPKTQISVKGLKENAPSPFNKNFGNLLGSQINAVVTGR